MERLAQGARGMPREEGSYPAMAYRLGYLAEDRRSIERIMQWSEMGALVKTSAMELGLDTRHIGAVMIAGYSGSIASVWQRLGRAARSGEMAMILLAALEDMVDNTGTTTPESSSGRGTKWRASHCEPRGAAPAPPMRGC